MGSLGRRGKNQVNARLPAPGPVATAENVASSLRFTWSGGLTVSDETEEGTMRAVALVLSGWTNSMSSETTASLGAAPSCTGVLAKRYPWVTSQMRSA